jgi:hypothetical protein
MRDQLSSAALASLTQLANEADWVPAARYHGNTINSLERHALVETRERGGTGLLRHDWLVRITPRGREALQPQGA